MRLVKAVSGELLHQVEDADHFVFGVLPLDGSVDKACALLGHLLRILLAHGAAQQVGFAQGVAGEHVGDLHHLLLVDDDAERLLEQGFQLRQLVADDSAAPLALDEVVDHATLDGTGTVERIEGGQVFYRVRLIASQHIAHAAGLELENAGSQRAMKDFLVGLRIVQWDQRHIERASALALNELQRVVNHGERGEPKKVHLEQAQLLHRFHVIRGDDFVVLAAADGHQFGEGLRGNHHAGGMQTGSADQSLQLAGGIDQFLYLGLFVVGLLHLRGILQRLGDGDANRRGDHLGYAIYFAVGQIERPADILNGCTCCHGVEGDDLRDLVSAVLAGDVVDHFSAPVHAEINVDIGHGYALGIQEPLEEQRILERIDIGDLHGIGDQRSGCGTAAGADGNIDFTSVLDEVPNDEEVAGELHLLDAVNFTL